MKTFSVASGSVVALVGASGSGKTTAANLAMRLWDPDKVASSSRAATSPR